MAYSDNYFLYFVPVAYPFGFPMTTLSFFGVTLSLFLAVSSLLYYFSLVARSPGGRWPGVGFSFRWRLLWHMGSRGPGFSDSGRLA